MATIERGVRTLRGLSSSFSFSSPPSLTAEKVHMDMYVRIRLPTAYTVARLPTSISIMLHIRHPNNSQDFDPSPLVHGMM